MKPTRLLALGFVLVLTVPAVAGAHVAKPACPSTRGQARAVVRHAERQGAHALRALAARSHICWKRAHHTDPLSSEIVARAPKSLAVAADALDPNGFTSSVTTAFVAGYDGYIASDDWVLAGARLAAAKPPIAHAASTCKNSANLKSTDRVYYHGVHFVSVTKTLQGWCYDGSVVISTNNWGHAWYVKDPYCLGGKFVAHGPDGSWIGSHSTWAHGFAGATLGTPGTGLCLPIAGISDRQWPAVVRVAGNGYWDVYDDYPNPYHGG